MHARAQSAADLFVATNVPVSETGSSAVEARDKAIAVGQVKALRQVMERLVAPDELDRLPNVPAAQVPPMVQSIELHDERTAGTQYRANMTVRFFPDAVRRVMRSATTAFAAEPAPPAVVLPLYTSGRSDHLWEEPNPWREAWAAKGKGSPLVPLVVPYGDLQDVQTISARDALDGSKPALDAIAKRYGVEDVVVVHATEQSGGGLEVTVSRYWPGGALTPVDRFIGASSAAGLAAAVEQATGRMADAIRSGEPARPGTAVAATGYGSRGTPLQGRAQLTTRVSYADLGQWLQIGKVLRQIPNIDELLIDSVSARDAQVVLNYAGTTDQLREALGRANLDLRNDGPYWVLAVLDPMRPVALPPPGSFSPAGRPGYAAPAPQAAAPAAQPQAVPASTN